MNSSAPILASDTEHDSHAFNDDLPEALECWSLQDFIDILGGQLL
jgi:hypothetical protein